MTDDHLANLVNFHFNKEEAEKLSPKEILHLFALKEILYLFALKHKRRLRLKLA